MKKKTTEVKTRAELPEELCWDLTKVYADAEAWEKDFSRLDELLQKALSFKGRLGEGAAVLKGAFEANDALWELESQLAVYSHLKRDEDTANAVNAGRQDRLETKLADFAGAMAWFQPELLSIPQKTFDSYRKSKTLKFYKRSLDNLERQRAHTLSEPEERILGLSSDALNAADKIYSILNDTDLRFPKIKGEDGKPVEVTHGNYISLLQSSDRRVRKDAYKALYSVYKNFIHTLAATLEGTVKTGVLEAKLRKYPGALEAALSGGNIPVSVYSNLIDTVHAALPSLHRYFAVRAKSLGLEQLQMYDIMNPLVPDMNDRIEWEQAVKMVKHALKPLGKEYCAILDRAFEERWIDVPECRGKRSGAYSSGSYRKPPYILLNYDYNLESVFTLAHELGHSMHSYYSDQAQEFHYAQYRIFAAEVASTTNELLLYHDLMKNTKSRKMKAYLVNFLLNTIRGTAFRQTMFAEFERDIYQWSETGKPLTADALSERYLELNKQYHGPAVKTDEFISYEWARIPHFHYDFYVYQYATGISAAAALSRDILNGNTERYRKFLEAGCSKDVIDILKDAGVDFTTPAPVEACMKLFDDTVTELEKLL